MLCTAFCYMPIQVLVHFSICLPNFCIPVYRGTHVVSTVLAYCLCWRSKLLSCSGCNNRFDLISAVECTHWCSRPCVVPPVNMTCAACTIGIVTSLFDLTHGSCLRGILVSPLLPSQDWSQGSRISGVVAYSCLAVQPGSQSPSIWPWVTQRWHSGHHVDTPTPPLSLRLIISRGRWTFLSPVHAVCNALAE